MGEGRVRVKIREKISLNPSFGFAQDKFFTKEGQTS
jgi:hypothetical protein